jgi:putative SOS response-associated peptidase YedK
MCGRFSLYTPPARVARFFGATLAAGVDPDGDPSWNIGPTRDVAGITVDPRHTPAGDGGEAANGGRLLDVYRWGLIPSWAKDPSVGSRLFNARAETVANRASFRAAFESRRAVIPADGFFEWRKPPTGGRIPHFFHRVDGDLMAFAGLWELWRDPQSPADHGGWLRSCTIITTRASQDMDGIHNRMPVVLEPSVLDVWLDPGNGDRHELEDLLRPPAPGTLAHHRVDNRVGNVRNDDSGLVAEVHGPVAGETPTQQSLLDQPPG